MQRDDIVKLIIDERLKQMDIASPLGDFNKTKNDWTATAAYYLFETASRVDHKVSFEEFRSSLIKASAIILAALECSFNHEEIQNKEINSLMMDLNS